MVSASLLPACVTACASGCSWQASRVSLARPISTTASPTACVPGNSGKSSTLNPQVNDPRLWPRLQAPSFLSHRDLFLKRGTSNDTATDPQSRTYPCPGPDRRVAPDTDHRRDARGGGKAPEVAQARRAQRRQVPWSTHDPCAARPKGAALRD